MKSNYEKEYNDDFFLYMRSYDIVKYCQRILQDIFHKIILEVNMSVYLIRRHFSLYYNCHIADWRTFWVFQKMIFCQSNRLLLSIHLSSEPKFSFNGSPRERVTWVRSCVEINLGSFIRTCGEYLLVCWMRKKRKMGTHLMRHIVYSMGF